MKKERTFPALRGVTGNWGYYVCLMSMRDVSDIIGYARDIHKSKKLSDMLQRTLQDNDRGKAIAEYLLKDKERFFNSLVVATYGGEPRWYALESIGSSPEEMPLDKISSEAQNSIGFLKFSGEEDIFALDGQHRLAGIRAALKENKQLGDEEIPVIFVAHHNTPQGMIRSRKLFTNLNKHAKPVSTQEIIALDENDAMAIVTRKLVEEHKYFSDDRIKFKAKQIGAGDKAELTTIVNLYDILTILFSKILFQEKIIDLRLYRPNDEKIDTYYQGAVSYFQGLEKTFPALQEYFSAVRLETLEKIIAKYRHDKGGHIMFRPVGLSLMTEVVAHFVSKKMKIDEILSLLKNKCPVNFTDEPYKDLIWDSIQHKAKVGGKALCRDLLIYMLGGKIKNTDKLKQRYARHLGVSSTDCELPDKL